MTLYLLAFHFIYRYLAVCKPHQLDWFTYPYFIVFIGTFIFVTFDWWLAAVYFAGEDYGVEEYIRENMLRTFNLKSSDYTYAVSLFYPGPIEASILPLMATQPIIDSLVPMYFIKDYRKAISRIFAKLPVPEASTTSPGHARVHPI
uniref:EXS domain-containing protein n=1 Tax=Caenorhabditis tropicalis TaxID=1561998 RepID=A0A1I7V2X9_9PELO